MPLEKNGATKALIRFVRMAADVNFVRSRPIVMNAIVRSIRTLASVNKSPFSELESRRRSMLEECEPHQHLAELPDDRGPLEELGGPREPVRGP